MSSILPHNIVNDTKWQRMKGGYEAWVCYPGSMGKVEFWKVQGNNYRMNAPLVGVVRFEADSVPAAKAEALRLVREAILAEAEAWR